MKVCDNETFFWELKCNCAFLKECNFSYFVNLSQDKWVFNTSISWDFHSIQTLKRKKEYFGDFSVLCSETSRCYQSWFYNSVGYFTTYFSNFKEILETYKTLSLKILEVSCNTQKIIKITSSRINTDIRFH